jgi:hypothetical protein
MTESLAGSASTGFRHIVRDAVRDVSPANEPRLAALWEWQFDGELAARRPPGPRGRPLPIGRALAVYGRDLR